MTTVVFSIALNGYDRTYGSCLESQRAYCRKFNFRYWLVDSVPWLISPRQSAWLKVEIMQGLLLAGVENVAFFDADCEIREHSPSFVPLVSGERTIALAPGKSGRLNSGVIFARNEHEVTGFLALLIAKCDEPVPKHDATPFENGHFIHYGHALDCINALDHSQWNNNSHFNITSYVQHYSSGELRRLYKLPASRADDYDLPKTEADYSNTSVSNFLFAAKEYFKDTYGRYL